MSNAELAAELERLIHEVGNVFRAHQNDELGDALSFAIYNRDHDKAKIALASHVLDQWGPILTALTQPNEAEALKHDLTRSMDACAEHLNRAEALERQVAALREAGDQMADLLAGIEDQFVEASPLLNKWQRASTTQEQSS